MGRYDGSPYENFGFCIYCHAYDELASILIDKSDELPEGLCKSCQEFYQEYFDWPDCVNGE